ncbi:MAG: hypothetical protein MK052_10075, partial [Alphaproteobacteria bacterium]|nr:hypothetical protein [Alphaproteobacteria bacterium]
ISIGDNARIGSNAVVVSNVKNDATMVGVPAHSIEGRERQKDKASGLCKDFSPYAIPKRGMKDPVDNQLVLMAKHIETLQARLDTLEGKEQGAGTATRWDSKKQKSAEQ